MRPFASDLKQAIVAHSIFLLWSYLREAAVKQKRSAVTNVYF